MFYVIVTLLLSHRNVKARSGDGSLTGGAVAALVFAVLFCLVGVGALYYTTCRKRPVLKI